MERLRVPFLVVALVAALLIVVVELGSLFGIRMGKIPVGNAAQIVQTQFPDCDNGNPEPCQKLVDQMVTLQQQQGRPPGLGVPYLALIDGILLFTAVLLGLQLVVPERMLGRLQGIATLIFSIIVIIVGIILAIVAFVLLLLRVTLLLAVPFGTITYFALFGFFNRGGAAAALGVLLFLKLAFVVLLLLANQRFLKNKGLVLLVVTSLVLDIVVAFLHNIVPLFLVSITDAVAALVIAIVAVVWGIVLLVGAIVSIVKVLRLSRG